MAQWPDDSISRKLHRPLGFHRHAIAGGGRITPLPQCVDCLRVCGATSAVDHGHLVQPSIDTDYEANLQVRFSSRAKRGQRRRQRPGGTRGRATRVIIEGGGPIRIGDCPGPGLRARFQRRYGCRANHRQQQNREGAIADSRPHQGGLPMELGTLPWAIRLPAAHIPKCCKCGVSRILRP